MITSMLDDAPGRISIESTQAPSFNAADYLLGHLQHSIATQQNSRIALPGKGEIAVFPRRGVYYARIEDMAEFCQAPAPAFAVSPIANESAATFGLGPQQNLTELLWEAAFHASQGRLVNGCSKYDVVQFRHWPNLSRLPATKNAMRICALLTRHATTIMLVHRKLGIEHSEIYQIYSAAHCAGLTLMVSRNPEATGVEAPAANDNAEPEQPRGIVRALFSKIAGL